MALLNLNIRSFTLQNANVAKWNMKKKKKFGSDQWIGEAPKSDEKWRDRKRDDMGLDSTTAQKTVEARLSRVDIRIEG